MLEILINLTIVLTISISTILVLKRLFNKWMSPTLHVSIWLLIIPFIFISALPGLQIHSHISIRNFLPYAEEIAYHISDDPSESMSAKVEINNISINENAKQQNLNESTEVSPTEATSELAINPVSYVSIGSNKFEINKTVEVVILLVWFTGIVVIGFLEVSRYIRLCRELAQIPVCEEPEVLTLYDACRDKLNIKHKLPIKVGADSSMIVGFIKKTVCIKSETSNEELKYVLTHELCHYKLGDIWNNLAATAMLVLSWFNPIVHIAFHTFKRDIEIRCDNLAIETLGERKAYAEVLINSAVNQRGFIFASTSFLTGEKEIVTRIKRIADTTKPKLVLEVFVLISALFVVIACTTLPNATSTESVKLNDRYQIDVPLSWLDNMKMVTENHMTYENPDVQLPIGSKFFVDNNGHSYASIFIAEDVFTQEEWLKVTNHVSSDGTPYSYPGVEITDSFLDEHVDAAVERYFKKGYTDIRKKSLPKSGILGHEYKKFYLYEVEESILSSKGYSTKFYDIGAMLHSGTLVILAAKDGTIEDEEILTCIDSFRTSENDGIRGMQLSGIEEFQSIHKDVPRPTLSKKAYEKYVKQTLNEAFEWYVKRDVPVEKSIKDYKITKITEITEVYGLKEGEKPGKVDYYLDNARWDIIYPYAKAYRVTYELTPSDKRYYEGETDFEQIAVFTINNYVSPIYDGDGAMPKSHVSALPPYYAPADFYFLGFVDETESNYYGQDQEILYMLNQWFVSLNPMSDPNYQTDYVGDARSVAKIINSLPLHEYIDTTGGTFTEHSIILQTKTEPYGITINYNFNNKLTSVSNKIWFTPVDSQRQTILNMPINKYVANQLMHNINQLYSRIGNLDEITINAHYIDEASKMHVSNSTYTIHSTRDAFYGLN